ncbi:SAM-dependent methyltransferase [Actinoplanes sp. NPDC051475]|uniref:SAM-dependent methyltransferase n=1 Tax=Actinoplanes sp. NPDC051475 TaxID=3157225 RepID=UPI00344F979D
MSRETSANRINIGDAHPARRYNYWLGGKDNFAADRASADAIEKIFPHIRTAAIENRRFLQRAVRWLTAKAGIRQFLDIGTGIPSADNTHEVAQRHAPDARVLYVDNDPIVLTHARALLTSHPLGRTEFIDADLRHPETILDDPALKTTLDLTQPVALLLVAVLHFLTDHDDPYTVVTNLLDRLAPGSYLVLSHATVELLPAETATALTDRDVPGRGDFTSRTYEQVERFFDGLEFVPPGLTVASQWRPEPASTPASAQQVAAYAGIARKPETTIGLPPEAVLVRSCERRW